VFTLNELPPQIAPEILKLLGCSEPATIGHFHHTGFMDPGIRGLLPDKRIAGTAVTIRFGGIDSTIVHYALGKLRPGDFLVMDRLGDMRHAACGGGVAFAARAAGAIGIIIDGLATDIGEIREYGLPVWARGLSALTSKRQFLLGEFCVTISCGGVAVRPGDAILADENGILVIDPSEARAAAERAIQMQDLEKVNLARVAQGEKLPDLNGTSERIRAIMSAH
jgi:regulator of RNase E activity RraA